MTKYISPGIFKGVYENALTRKPSNIYKTNISANHYLYFCMPVAMGLINQIDMYIQYLYMGLLIDT